MHSPRAVSHECNLFTYDMGMDPNNIASMSFSLGLAEMLRNDNINYMSRNILFVGYDGRYQEFGFSIKSFL